MVPGYGKLFDHFIRANNYKQILCAHTYNSLVPESPHKVQVCFIKQLPTFSFQVLLRESSTRIIAIVLYATQGVSILHDTVAIAPCPCMYKS